MKKMLKTILTAVLFSVLFVSAIKSVEAAVTESFDEATGVLTISGDGAIGTDSYESRNDIKEVIIKGNVTVIGSFAFAGCTSLEKIDFSEANITSIERDAFSGCTSLSEVTLPASMTTIGDWAFIGCTSLEKINFSEAVTSVGQGAFITCTALTTIMGWDNVTSIGYAAFSGCTGLTELIMPKNLTSIGDEAFGDCSNLIKVTICNNVGWNRSNSSSKSPFMSCGSPLTVEYTDSATEIGSGLFSGCSNIETLTIPANISKIGASAFSGCRTLSAVTIEGTELTIDSSAFLNCNSLKKLEATNGAKIQVGISTFSNCSGLDTFDDISITSVGYEAFKDCEALTYVPIDSSMTSIGKYAFMGCVKLTDIDFHLAEVIEISEGAFKGCTGLKEIKLSDDTKTIAHSAFSECVGLETIDLANVETIGVCAFQNCTGITEVSLPASVTSISAYAFSGCNKLAKVTVCGDASYDMGAYQYYEAPFASCDSLTTVEFTDKVTAIGSGLFTCCEKVAELTIPANVISIGKNAFEKCSGLEKVMIEGDNLRIEGAAFLECSNLKTVTGSENGVKLDLGSTGVYGMAAAFRDCSALESLNNVTIIAIGDAVFCGCSSLKTVPLGEGVSAIVESAFEGCESLTDISFIPDGVKTINSSAFKGCTGLKELVLPESLTAIGDCAFQECTGIKELILPESIKKVGTRAFYGCTELGKVVINSNVTTSGQYAAFGGCTSLNTIEYAEGVEFVGKSIYDVDVNLFDGCNSVKEIIIPTTVTHIFTIVKSPLESVTIKNPDIDVSSAVLGSSIEKIYFVNGVSDVEAMEGILSKSNNIYCSIEDANTEQVEALIDIYPNVYGYLPDDTTGMPAVVNVNVNDAKSMAELLLSGVDTEGKTLEWATSAECIEIDENGMLTANSVGMADVTVTVTDISAESPVVVYKAIVTVSVLEDETGRPALMFSSASLLLQDNLAINYKVDASLLDEGYSELRVEFSFNDKEIVVSDYKTDDNKLVFQFSNIAPQQMNDVIEATLYATYDGEEYASVTTEYSVATYCYNQLDNLADVEDTKFIILRTLLVDILNYGAAAQKYVEYNTGNLVNANLTEVQLGWGTSEERTFNSVLKTDYKTVNEPTATWTGASLYLADAVVIKFKIAAQNTEGLEIKLALSEAGLTSGEARTISSDKFETTDVSGEYCVYFDGLNAGQMSDTVYAVVCKNNNVVSNTITYSIESYASTVTDEDAHKDLVIAMMKYGDAAKAYSTTE